MNKETDKLPYIGVEYLSFVDIRTNEEQSSTVCAVFREHLTDAEFEKKTKQILKIMNSHNRLVEALTSLVSTVEWLADNNGDDATKWDATFKEVEDVKQLLTELKQD